MRLCVWFCLWLCLRLRRVLESMAEAVKVVIRCRPLSKKENRESRKPIVTIHKALQVVSIADPENASAPPRDFTFDGVYGADTVQAATGPAAGHTRARLGGWK